MLSAADIRNVKFTKSMSGYKQEEVEILLDKIEADYAQFDRVCKDYQAKIDSLNKEIEGYKVSQNSLQNVLLSAQKLADQIIDEAKVKSEEIISKAESNISLITAREKELSTTFELKAQDRKNKLQEELNQMIINAQHKAESIIAAAEDSTARQQVLFDKLKMEVAAFKAAIQAKYKEHLSVLQTLPDSVPMDPKHITELVSNIIDKAPDPAEFIKPISDDTSHSDSVITDNSAPEVPDNTSSSGFEVKLTEEPPEHEPEIDY